MLRNGLALLLLFSLMGCKEEPHRIQNDNLGIIATFPGEPTLYRHTEPGPFGEVEWFDLAMSPAGRLDETFTVAVGNLPPGSQGGTTPREILTTFQNFLGFRLGRIQRRDLPAAKGPGFRYKGKGISGQVVEGVVVVRQGRLHHAQAIVRKEGDPRTAAFLDDFEVTTR